MEQRQSPEDGGRRSGGDGGNGGDEDHDGDRRKRNTQLSADEEPCSAIFIAEESPMRGYEGLRGATHPARARSLPQTRQSRNVCKQCPVDHP